MPPAKTNPEYVDVAAAARVHDQSIVALMWARAAVLGGCSFLAAGLWPPVSWEIAVNGLALSAFGLGLLWLLSDLGNRGVAIILCVGLALAGLSIGWNAWQRAQPAFAFTALGNPSRSNRPSCVSAWHAAQSCAVPTKRRTPVSTLWHIEHATPRCAPSNGNAHDWCCSSPKIGGTNRPRSWHARHPCAAWPAVNCPS